VFLVGEPEAMRKVAREIARAGRADVVGFAGPRTPQLGQRLGEAGAETIVLAVDGAAGATLRILLARASPSVEVASVDEYCERILGKIPIDPTVPPRPALSRQVARSTATADLLRHGLSRIAALVVLAALTPLALVAAAFIWLAGGSPVLVRELRIGQWGNPFSLVLPSSTWAGRMLVRLHLGRLPALWNVLWGDLALVGPRPLTPRIAREAKRYFPPPSERPPVRPGWLSWRGAPSAPPSADSPDTLHELGLDLYYLRHRSLRLDLLILWRALGAAAISTSR
jgi:lipopolysaccharide/colanic/teichoic acid biosynthesis glycosyltransferase